MPIAEFKARCPSSGPKYHVNSRILEAQDIGGFHNYGV